MLQHAFKEWAVICQALASGRQAVIIRKGGISEKDGTFQVDHQRFWLYPTYAHQQREGIKPEAEPHLEEVLAKRPLQGKVRLSHFAEVGAVYLVTDHYDAAKLAALHLWSDATVGARFHNRQPGLVVIAVRLFQAKNAIEIVETPAMAGCKSWVELEKGLSTEGAKPVLNDISFHEVLNKVTFLLEPPAYA
ncbi:MAG TPA: DUF1802 family protein [Gemmataceae bacterium]|jgi:hypothetical protein|nr:DUF1802 family protein [Gemmataceae bacterium]